MIFKIWISKTKATFENRVDIESISFKTVTIYFVSSCKAYTMIITHTTSLATLPAQYMVLLMLWSHWLRQVALVHPRPRNLSHSQPHVFLMYCLGSNPDMLRNSFRSYQSFSSFRFFFFFSRLFRKWRESWSNAGFWGDAVGVVLLGPRVGGVDVREALEHEPGHQLRLAQAPDRQGWPTKLRTLRQALLGQGMSGYLGMMRHCRAGSAVMNAHVVNTHSQSAAAI